MVRKPIEEMTLKEIALTLVDWYERAECEWALRDEQDEVMDVCERLRELIKRK